MSTPFRVASATPAFASPDPRPAVIAQPLPAPQRPEAHLPPFALQPSAALQPQSEPEQEVANPALQPAAATPWTPPPLPQHPIVSPFAVVDELPVMTAPPVEARFPGATVPNPPHESPFAVISNGEFPPALGSPFSERALAPIRSPQDVVQRVEPPLTPPTSPIAGIPAAQVALSARTEDATPAPRAPVPPVFVAPPAAAATAPLPTGPMIVPPPAAAPAGAETISLGLGALLRHVSPESLGFQPEKVPASVRVVLPLAPVRAQLPSGRVLVPLRTIIENLDPRLQPAFARSQRDLNLTIPLAEIFRNLPMGAVPEQARPPQTVAPLFQTPFSTKAQEDASLWRTMPAQPVVSQAAAPPAAAPPAAAPPAKADASAAFPRSPAPIEPPRDETPPAFRPPFLQIPAPPATIPTPAPSNLRGVAGPSRSGSDADQPGGDPASNSVFQKDATPAVPPATTTAREPERADVKPPAFLPPWLTGRELPPSQDKPMEAFTPRIDEPEPATPKPSAPPQVPPTPPASDRVLPALGPSVTPAWEPPITPIAPIAKPDKPSKADLPERRSAGGAALPRAFATAPGEGVGAMKKMELPIPEFDEDPIPLESLTPHAKAPPEAVSPAPPRSSFGPPTKSRAAVVLPPVVPPAPPPPAENLAEVKAPPTIRTDFPAVSGSPPVAPAPPPSSSVSGPAPLETCPAPEPKEPIPDTSTTSSTVAPLDDLTFGYVEDATQLALRAIFATEKILRPQDVIDLSSQFPGLRGCLIITPEGVMRSGRLDDSEEVRHFAEKAGALFEKTSSLISELDLGGEQTFTLRTGRSIMSFFTSGNICLAVLHAEPNFQPGVREKLVLLARELARMLAA